MLKPKTILVVLVLSCTAAYGESNCSKIPLSKNLHFKMEIEATGKRGTLRFPAIIDTGATHSLIPESIANGIGYDNPRKKEFRTVNGNSSFTVIKLKKLKFGETEFTNIEVAVEKKSNRPSYYLPPPQHPCLPGSRQWWCSETKTTKSNSEPEELAIIGMSELKNTNFTYKENFLTVCQ